MAPGGVYFETKQEAWEEFQKAYEGNPIQDSLTVEQMQESFRVKLKNPEQYQGVVSAVVGLKGVQAVQDLQKYLDPFFCWLRLLQWGTIVRLGACCSWRPPCRSATPSGWPLSPGVERSASCAWSERAISISHCRSLFEAVISALIGILFASVTLASGVYFIIMQKAQVSIRTLPWIGWQQTGWPWQGLPSWGSLLSIIPTLITTRKYLRV